MIARRPIATTTLVALLILFVLGLAPARAVEVERVVSPGGIEVLKMRAILIGRPCWRW